MFIPAPCFCAPRKCSSVNFTASYSFRCNLTLRSFRATCPFLIADESFSHSNCVWFISNSHIPNFVCQYISHKYFNCDLASVWPTEESLFNSWQGSKKFLVSKVTDRLFDWLRLLSKYQTVFPAWKSYLYVKTNPLLHLVVDKDWMKLTSSPPYAFIAC